jgi:hypothetical protein
MAAWRQVEPNEAMQNPLYGVGGWLLFFMILQIIGIVFNIYQLTQSVDETQTITAIVGLVIGLLIVLLCFSKSRSFPTVAIVLLWIGTGLAVISAIVVAGAAGVVADVTLAAAGVPVTPEARELFVASMITSAIVGVVIAGVIAGLMTWYLIASKRVNVTYRFRVPA